MTDFCQNFWSGLFAPPIKYLNIIWFETKSQGVILWTGRGSNPQAPLERGSWRPLHRPTWKVLNFHIKRVSNRNEEMMKKRWRFNEYLITRLKIWPKITAVYFLNICYNSNLTDMLNPFKKHFSDSTETLALQHGQFISRVFSDTSGRQFRLTFFVTIVAGEPRGHLVSAQPISASSHLRLAGSCASSMSSVCQIFCLPVACPKKEIENSYIPAYTPVASPYFSLEFLINSQPTRAPSRA